LPAAPSSALLSPASSCCWTWNSKLPALWLAEMPLGEILDLGPGDVVQLDRHVSDPWT